MPEERILRLYVGTVSISKDSAAFESEFDSVFTEGVPHGEKSREIEDEIIQKITMLKEQSTGKKKKIYGRLIKHVHAESLCDKMMYALKQYSGCVDKIKQRFAPKLTNEYIAEVCSGIRNDVDHGNKISEISQDSVSGFIVIRALVYAIQLRKVGMDDESINICTNNLFLLPQVLFCP